MVSTHSRPKAADRCAYLPRGGLVVSTHSRPKAAERDEREIKAEAWGFNTQPPEGG